MLNRWEPIKGTTIIGIGHKARQGKDTAANYLRDNFGAVKFSFANGLYTVARALFGMTEKDAPLLQALGTEVGRRNDSDRWVRTLYYQIKDECPRIAVIPDCRFPNEADFVKQLGGFMIKVVRLDKNGERFVAPDRSHDHPSEVALDDYTDWDSVIVSTDGDIEGLQQAAAESLQGCVA